MNKWTKDVSKFPDAPSGSSIWIGSSIIRLWRLNSFFPDRGFINRGFGGACVTDCFHFFDLLTRNDPRQIVFYAGDNDLAAGVEPSEVASTITGFVTRVKDHLPSCNVVMIPIKPSRMRWRARAEQLEVDRLVRLKNEGVVHVPPLDAFLTPPSDECEVCVHTLARNGGVRCNDHRADVDERYLLGDGLHLNDAGYSLLTHIITPFVT